MGHSSAVHLAIEWGRLCMCGLLYSLGNRLLLLLAIQTGTHFAKLSAMSIDPPVK